MMALVKTPRGERNNNPGNLRYGPRIKWRGLDNPPLDDSGYCRFLNPRWGIRALARDLTVKGERGLKTVRRLLYVYAPPIENDTEAYIRDVCNRLGVEPDAELNLTDKATLIHLVKGIINHECGRIIYSYDVIEQAVGMALP